MRIVGEIFLSRRRYAFCL